jgi:hypothetical protein
MDNKFLLNWVLSLISIMFVFIVILIFVLIYVGK